MKTGVKFLVLFLVCAIALSATERKRVQKSFKVDAGKLIEIYGVSGMNVNVSSYDGNEVKFDINVSIRASSDKFEKKYIENFVYLVFFILRT